MSKRKRKVIPRNDTQYSALASSYVIKDPDNKLSFVASLSNNLYNAALYLLRQRWFKHHKIRKMSWLDKEFKRKVKMHENALYSLFPYRQIAQQTLREVSTVWYAWRMAMKAYKKHPEKFTGRPRIPGYLDKGSRHVFHVTNQNAKLKNGYLIIHPKNDLMNVKLKLDSKITNFKRVTFKPMSKGWFKVIVQYGVNKDIQYLPDNGNYMGIDPGVDNAFVCVTNTGARPLIINGKNVKSINHRYNYLIAKLSKKHAKYGQNYFIKQTKNGPKKCYFYSKAQQSIVDWRNQHIMEFGHQATNRIIDYAVNNDINTIVIGKNKYWKRSSDMGKKNNQNFVGIPHAKMINMLIYKANLHGISVICTTEGYTSQTSFLDNEKPCWANGNKSRKNRGLSPIYRRIKRGLFKSNKGILINADVNGAFQIMKKVFSNVHVTDEIAGVVLCPTKWTATI